MTEQKDVRLHLEGKLDDQAAREKTVAALHELQAAMGRQEAIHPALVEALQGQLKASRAAALEAEERIVELEKELHEECQAFKRERAAFLETHHHETNVRELAEENTDAWRSLCLGLLEVSFAIIERLSVDFEMVRATWKKGDSDD